MKKIFSLVAIAAVAATMFTSCKDDDTKETVVIKAKLTLTAAPMSVEVTKDGEFTVTSDIAAPEAIVIAVKSSAEATLTVDPASVTIPKGEKTIKGKFTGVANGKATITITTTTANTTITAGSVEITVGTPAPAGAKIVVGTVNYTTDPTKDNDWASFVLPSSDGKDGQYQIGGLWVTNNLNGTPGSSFNTVIDNYGQKAYGVAAGTRINLSIAEEGVAISTLTFAENSSWSGTNFWEAPVIYSDTYTSLAGKTGYLVMYFDYIDTDNDIAEGVYPAWIKVSVSSTGAVTVSDFAIMTSEGEFKTGQKS